MPNVIRYVAPGGVFMPEWKLTRLDEGRNIRGTDIREAVEENPVVWSAWAYDKRGWRMIVVGDTYSGRRLKVVVTPVDLYEGQWNLCTAYEDDGKRPRGATPSEGDLRGLGA